MCKSSYPAQIEAPFKTVEVFKTSSFSIDMLLRHSAASLEFTRTIRPLSPRHDGFGWSVVWELGPRGRRKCAARVQPKRGAAARMGRHAASARLQMDRRQNRVHPQLIPSRRGSAPSIWVLPARHWHEHPLLYTILQAAPPNLVGEKSD